MIDDLFKDIPFDEAYKTTMQYDRERKELKSKGAVLNGSRELDKQYTTLMKDALKYSMQFSQDELFAIMGRALEEHLRSN